MAENIFIKHKIVNTIPQNPEVGTIYYERDTGIEKIVENDSTIHEIGNIELILKAKIGEGQNSNIFNDLNNTATGDNAHAEGSNTSASGPCAHAEGSSTIANGEFSHAEGYNTNANGNYSHAQGYGTETKNTAECAIGQYNVSNNTDGQKTIFTIGNGTGPDNRSNLFEIKEDGSIYVKNLGNYDGTNSDIAISLQDTILSQSTGGGLNLLNVTDTVQQTIVTQVPELTENFIVPSNNTINKNTYVITIGNTKYDIIGSEDIIWKDGLAPITNSNHKYVISIMLNLGVWAEF